MDAKLLTVEEFLSAKSGSECKDSRSWTPCPQHVIIDWSCKDCAQFAEENGIWPCPEEEQLDFDEISDFEEISDVEEIGDTERGRLRLAARQAAAWDPVLRGLRCSRRDGVSRSFEDLVVSVHEHSYPASPSREINASVQGHAAVKSELAVARALWLWLNEHDVPEHDDSEWSFVDSPDV
mmetsp:Transcript_52298/g.93791  ORF Transcript_52298/g.93791 Transcript_52298/m.93791 type:complete len:180 (+) Transcript_52298:51-590(+)